MVNTCFKHWGCHCSCFTRAYYKTSEPENVAKESEPDDDYDIVGLKRKNSGAMLEEQLI